MNTLAEHEVPNSSVFYRQKNWQVSIDARKVARE